MSLLALFLFSFIALSSASHYRYGTMSWTTIGPNTVNITIETAWRWSYYNNPALGSKIGFNDLFFGDGQKTVFWGIVTTVNKNDDWIITLSTVTHTYKTPFNPATNSSWVAYFHGGQRITTLRNNANRDWQLTTTIDCNLASSPKSKMLPIANVLFVSNSLATFTVPAVTDDNTQIHYRLGTSMEICGGGGCINPPTVAVDQVTGTVTLNTSALTPGLWCAVIMISNDRVMVPVDFIINYTRVAGKCDSSCPNQGKACFVPTDCGSCSSSNACVKPLPPVFINPAPTNNVTYTATAGNEIAFNITAYSPQSSSTVRIQESSMPVGVAISADTPSNPDTRVLTWTPSMDQIGPSILCFNAIDSSSLTSPQDCVTIEVSWGCKYDCPAKSLCIDGDCVCSEGYSGENCTTFGGGLANGEPLYGTVNMHSSNFYNFTVINGNAIKILVEVENPEYDVSTYVSTSNVNPTITSNTWDTIGGNLNTLVIYPNDPNYVKGEYYIGVEGWYAPYGNLINYNITVFY